jgi:hypothetical protein
MRNHAGLRLRPRQDFSGLLELLNSSRLQKTEFQHEIDEIVRTAPIPRLERRHRVAVEHAVWNLAEGAGASDVRHLGYAIETRFIQPLRRRGVSIDRALGAWRDVWRFILTECPEVKGRIQRCSWCRRFFYRYSGPTRTCSPVCRAGQSIVRHPPIEHRAVLKKVMLHFASQIRMRPPTPALTRWSETVVPLFFHPLHQRPRRPLRLRDVADQDAFEAVWALLFAGVRDLVPRMRRCVNCTTLFYAYNLRQLSCSRECQLSRYGRVSRRKVRRARR